MAQSPYIVVATPCYGNQVSAPWAESMLALQLACRDRGIRIECMLHGSDALITRARAELVARFLTRADATHLLFVDADIGFAPDQVFRMLEFRAEVTAAAYPLKQTDWPRVCRAVNAGAQGPAAAHYYVYGVANRHRVEARNNFIKANFAGTGFLMIERGVLTQLCAAHPELKYSTIHQPGDPLKDSPHRFALFDCLIDPKTGAYLSEDFAFCRRWADLGGEIWIDMQSRLTHIGAVPFIGDFATQFAPVQNGAQMPAEIHGTAPK